LFRLSSARFYFTSRQQAGLFDLNPIVLDQAALGRRRLGEESHASGAEQAFPTVLIFCLVHLQTELFVGIGSPGSTGLLLRSYEACDASPDHDQVAARRSCLAEVAATADTDHWCRPRPSTQFHACYRDLITYWRRIPSSRRPSGEDE
jgi:hypothetical protein